MLARKHWNSPVACVTWFAIAVGLARTVIVGFAWFIVVRDNGLIAIIARNLAATFRRGVFRVGA